MPNRCRLCKFLVIHFCRQSHIEALNCFCHVLVQSPQSQKYLRFFYIEYLLQLIGLCLEVNHVIPDITSIFPARKSETHLFHQNNNVSLPFCVHRLSHFVFVACLERQQYCVTLPAYLLWMFKLTISTQAFPYGKFANVSVLEKCLLSEIFLLQILSCCFLI